MYSRPEFLKLLVAGLGMIGGLGLALVRLESTHAHTCVRVRAGDLELRELMLRVLNGSILILTSLARL